MLRHPKTMRLLILLAVLISLAPDDVAFAQLSGTGDFHIVWEVKNRFRLFRSEADFLRQVAAAAATACSPPSSG